MNEKRKQRRVDVTWILRLPHRQGGLIQTRTVNVSGTGLLFVSPQSFTKGELLAVSMDVSSGCTLRAVIRITREAPGSSRIYTYGAEFVQFADNDRQRFDVILEAIRQRKTEGRIMAPVESAPSPAPVKQDTEVKPVPSPAADRRWGPTIDDSPDAAVRRF